MVEKILNYSIQEKKFQIIYVDTLPLRSKLLLTTEVWLRHLTKTEMTIWAKKK